MNYEIEQKEINLDNPIFVYYIDTRGLTRQQIDETYHQIFSKEYNYLDRSIRTALKN